MANLKNEVIADQIDHILSDCELYEKKGVNRNISQFARNAFVSTGVASQIVNLFDFVRINDYSSIAEYIKKYEFSKKYLKYIVEKFGYSYEEYMSQLPNIPTNDSIEIVMNEILQLAKKLGAINLTEEFIRKTLKEKIHVADSVTYFVALNRLEERRCIEFNKEKKIVKFLRYSLFDNKELVCSSVNDNSEVIKLLNDIYSCVSNDSLLLTACLQLTKISSHLHDIAMELIPNYDIKVKNREELLKHDREKVAKALDEKAKMHISKAQKEERENVK